MVDYKRLGERIAQARKEQMLSQETLAEMADITATNLSHIERGKIKTSIETMVALANALGVTANDLLCDSLDYATQEVANQIADSLSGCTPQELRLIADVATAVKKRLHE
jgi:transcriptional regulator with XRE-family HTH domain